ncbi:hypothetical protein [Bacillus benzoevorans]|uniref:Lipoprotein n=1 Tax=Bacillus benzoevorans TaxID=1456 RepID=A0A7X0HMX0_9BACI|nr:hypothetical protein [Bacillus benzoevorans]MBB6443719.1 hypothetical protein [Bacillus benzoevorans]
MKNMFYAGTLFMILMMLSACQKDIPEPETKKFVILQEAAVQASGLTIESNDSFVVKHQVRGSDVYFECMVKGTSFRNGGAKIILYIDGKRTKEVNNAAFIVKGLNKGMHKIKLELKAANQQTALAEKVMDIEIK